MLSWKLEFLIHNKYRKSESQSMFSITERAWEFIALLKFEWQVDRHIFSLCVKSIVGEIHYYVHF